MKSKKIISISLIFLIFICCFLWLTGCQKEYVSIKEDGFFKYIINYEKDGIIIIGLTDLGKEQETLVIPENVNNLKVKQIGAKILVGWKHWEECVIESERLKKIYIEKQISLSRKAFSGMEDLEIILIEPSEIYIEETSFPANSLFFTNSYTTLINKIGWNDFNPKNFAECNVVFYVLDNVYWLDNIESNGQYVSPNNPTIANLTFLGWYTEPEFINKWNGEYKIPEGQEKLNLYAKFE